MRRNSQNATRIAEQAGHQIADELQDVFAAANAGLTADKLREKQAAQRISSLRNALYNAVAGFNDAAPWDFQLAVINRGDCLIFNSCGQFTLTVALGERQVMLCPNRDTSQFSAPIALDILREEDVLRFRVQSSQASSGPVQTEREFLYNVIRMACHKQLRDPAPC